MTSSHALTGRSTPQGFAFDRLWHHHFQEDMIGYMIPMGVKSQYPAGFSIFRKMKNS